MTPEDALAYLASFPDWERGSSSTAETYTLDRMQRLLALLGHPDCAFPIVHVVGTKGKGSTAAMIVAAARAAGYRCGFFISPHLVDIRERVRINGELIPQHALATLVAERLKPTVDQMRQQGERLPLHFELYTALALDYFALQEVDLAVIEAGLGGRLDATNAVTQTALTVITTLGYDHMSVLGATLEEIAAEKAAVIRPHTPVVSAPQQPAARAVIERLCQERAAPLTVIGEQWQLGPLTSTPQGVTLDLIGPASLAYTGLQVGLAGPHQAINAATAVAALTLLLERFSRLTPAAVREGLAHVRWPGRLQTVSSHPLLLLDGAHNKESAEALALALQQLYPQHRFIIVTSVFSDKEVRSIFAPLLPLASLVLVTATNHPRALPAADLAAALDSLGARTERVPSMAQALERARELAGGEGAILVTGSLRAVGEAMQALGLRDDDTP